MSAAPQPLPSVPQPKPRRVGSTGTRPPGVGPNSCRPREAWLMLDAWDGDRRTGWGILSPTQQQMWRTLDARKAQSGERHMSTISENEWARKTGLSRRTIQRNVDAMVAKHAIEIWQAGSRDHTATIYRLVEYRECLKRCAEDDNIGVRLVAGVPHFFVWSHGRRLMSEHELGPEGWRIDLTPAAVPVERRENPGGGLAPPQTVVASDVSLRPAESQSTPPAELDAAVRRFRAGFEDVDGDAVETVWRAIVTAAAGRALTAREMAALVDDFAVYKPDCPNAAYLAGSIGGRTRMYLNRRAQQQQPERTRSHEDLVNEAVGFYDMADEAGTSEERAQWLDRLGALGPEIQAKARAKRADDLARKRGLLLEQIKRHILDSRDDSKPAAEQERAHQRALDDQKRYPAEFLEALQVIGRRSNR